jgi:hypothetical protein
MRSRINGATDSQLYSQSLTGRGQSQSSEYIFPLHLVLVALARFYLHTKQEECNETGGK